MTTPGAFVMDRKHHVPALTIGVGAGPADRRLPDQCYYANAPPPLLARIVHRHTVCKHGTCRICLSKVHETATPLLTQV